MYFKRGIKLFISVLMVMVIVMSATYPPTPVIAEVVNEGSSKESNVSSQPEMKQEDKDEEDESVSDSVYAPNENIENKDEFDNLTNHNVNSLDPQTVQTQSDMGNEIIGEIVDKREQYVKVFQKEDRSYEAAVYPRPVHYMNNGKWEDIDNTLTIKKDSLNNDVYENTANDFKVKFSKSVKSNKLITLSKQNYEISWDVKQLHSKDDGKTPTDVNDISPTVTSEDTTAQKNTSLNNKLMTLTNISSTIEYNNIYPDVNLQYIVNSNEIKENIIINQKSDSYKYLFNLDTKNLIAVLNDDKSITFYDENDQTKEVYKILAPWMYDANSNESTNIQVDLEKTQKGYILTLTPDSAWINSPDTKLPVTIDPSISTTSSDVDNTYVNSGSPTTNYNNDTFLQVGLDSSGHEYKSYVRPHLPQLTSSDEIIGASFNLVLEDIFYYDNPIIDLHEVTSNWSTNTVNWSNMPSYNPNIEDYQTMSGNGVDTRYTWDLTSLINKWYSTDINNGLMLQIYPGLHYTTYPPCLATFWSSRGAPGAYPQFTITYLSLNEGLIAHWAFDETSGNIAADSIGDADGDATSPTWVTGAIGNALNFNGSTSNVKINNSVIESDITNQLTVSMWVKANTLPAQGNVMQLLTSHPDRDPSTWNPVPSATSVVLNSAGQLEIAVSSGWYSNYIPSRNAYGDNYGNIFTEPGSISINTWHNIVLTYDKNTGKLGIYIDGILANEGIYPSPASASLKNLEFGGNYETGPRMFDGSMDDISIYNRVLAADEIALLFSQVTPPVPTEDNGSGGINRGLAARWAFDETSGNIAADSVGGVGATVTNPAWVEGRIGNALSFDGSSSTVNISEQIVTNDVTDQLTVSMWVKANKLPAQGNVMQLLTSHPDRDPNTWNPVPSATSVVLNSAGQLEIAVSSGWYSNCIPSGNAYGDNYGNIFTEPGSFTLNTWHNIVFTYDKNTGKLGIYIDGILANEGIYTSPASAGLKKLEFGGNYETGPRMFDGFMDDILIYNRVLAADEIAQLAAGATPYPINIIARNVKAGDTFNLVVTGANVVTPTKTVTISFNLDNVQLLDLCGFTYDPDILASGSIPGTNITIIQNTAEKIVFTVDIAIPNGKSWSGVLNVVKLKANADSPGITYTVQ